MVPKLVIWHGCCLYLLSWGNLKRSWSPGSTRNEIWDHDLGAFWAPRTNKRYFIMLVSRGVFLETLGSESGHLGRRTPYILPASTPNIIKFQLHSGDLEGAEPRHGPQQGSLFDGADLGADVAWHDRRDIVPRGAVGASRSEDAAGRVQTSEPTGALPGRSRGCRRGDR